MAMEHGIRTIHCTVVVPCLAGSSPSNTSRPPGMSVSVNRAVVNVPVTVRAMVVPGTLQSASSVSEIVYVTSSRWASAASRTATAGPTLVSREPVPNSHASWSSSRANPWSASAGNTTSSNRATRDATSGSVESVPSRSARKASDGSTGAPALVTRPRMPTT
jgi:hypothetical protein